MQATDDNMLIGRQTTFLRGAMVYRLQLRPGRALLHYDFLPSSRNNRAAWRRAKLRDMRPLTALGKLELLEQLVLKLQACEGGCLSFEWLAEAQRLITAARSALDAGDSSAAVSAAIDAAMLVGDLAAELHVPRDMKRQLGVREGGKAAKHCKGILLAAETLARKHPDWSAQQAWNFLIRHSEGSPFKMAGYSIFAGGPGDLCQQDEGTESVRCIVLKTFRKYWGQAKKPLSK